MPYCRKLFRFDAADRRARFSGNVSDAAIVGHVARTDWNSACLLGCFDGLALCAVAELHADAAAFPRGGEFAVTVLPGWRDRGIGTELLRRTIVLARNRMIGRLRMICLVDNRPMRHVAGKFGGRLEFEDGQILARLAVPFPDPVSLLAERFDDGMGFTAAFGARAC